MSQDIQRSHMAPGSEGVRGNCSRTTPGPHALHPGHSQRKPGTTRLQIHSSARVGCIRGHGSVTLEWGNICVGDDRSVCSVCEMICLFVCLFLERVAI